MRLIDADVLIKQIDNPYTEYPIMIQIRKAIKEFINSAPSIEPNLILPERMERGDVYEIGETIVVMNRNDYYDLLCKSMELNSSEKPNNSTSSKMEQVEALSCQECKHWIFDDRWGWFCPLKSQDECRYEPKDLVQFKVDLEYHTDTTHFGKVKGESITTNKVEGEPQTDCKTCKYGQDKHRYAHICNECGVGINNYTPQTERSE